MKKEATFTVSIGEVANLIDAWVTNQAGWEIYDEYGTEKHVYKCTGGNTPFYLYVDDDTAGYAEVKLWENWDNVSHTGSGNSTTTQYIVKYPATWRVVGDTDHIIVYCADTINYARGMYAGYTTPILADDTKAILILAANTSSSTNGWVTTHSFEYGQWLFKYGGGTAQNAYFYHPFINDDQAIAINGEGIVLFKPYVGESPQNKRARGIQKSIFGDGTALITGFSVGDTIYLDEMPYVARQCYNCYAWIKNG